MAEAAAPALAIHGLSKVFEGQKALSEVDFEVAQGEIHALLGQNGSGKSTLIKVLAGYHAPEPGATAELYGEPLPLNGAPPSPAEPIRFIHQDLGLMPDLDVIDNLALISGYEGHAWLGTRREAAATRAFLQLHGLDVDVRAPVSGLSTATQAMLAILRAIKAVPSERLVLVVDEATASLPGEEVKIVFRLLREIRDRGGSVIYVTHKLHEVLEIADRVTVLRDGRKVGTTAVAGLRHDDLVELIIGRSVEAFYAAGSARQEDVVLKVEDIAGGTCHGVSLEVRRGEIVGVTGLVGSGYESLLPLIFGAQERSSGAVWLEGEALSTASPARSIAAGLAFAPGDRKRLSAMPDWTLAQNITLPKLSSRGARLLPWLGDRAELRDAQRWIDQLAVEPRDPKAPLSSLSGGNQQRVVIARWIRCGFKALLLEDPTAGVDVGAKPAIFEALAKTVEDGAAVLLTTSDAEEAAAVCDRVVVLVDGRVGAVLEGEQKQPDVISAQAMQAKADDLIGASQ